ncbi:MAG: chorismate-binding protein, partial [Phycisphaerales bacterium]
CAAAPCRGDALDGSLQAALEANLDRMVATLEADTVRLQPGRIDDDAMGQPQRPVSSSTPPGAFRTAVERAKAYIRAGDAFPVVLSQRFQRTTPTDPFDLYRMLRVVNPSPYQAYLQGEGCILVASSPEILCRVRDGTVTNRPLAGTRRRGSDEAEDARLERELLADAKERAEHVMLVDLGRNDLGRVSELGSVQVKACMDVERYSHVMHISSTLEGSLRPGLDAWDALHAALPVGTVSGAPKVRAIQIIDELEPVRRGPYSGGLGCVGWNGDLDIALALRTMVIPTALHDPTRGTWRVDLQAGAGIVLDSDPAAEEDETINKAAALGRAIELAERSFGP